MARVAGAVRRADRAGVVIVGPAGVGKSRLVADCMDRGRTLGFEVVHARASSAASDIPFGALAALLPPDATRGGAEALAGAHAVLREAAGDRPLLLAVDDAHQLDDGRPDDLRLRVGDGRRRHRPRRQRPSGRGTRPSRSAARPARAPEIGAGLDGTCLRSRSARRCRLCRPAAPSQRPLAA